MKARHFPLVSAIVLALGFLLAGTLCSRTTRLNPEGHRAQTTTTGDAGKSENFGDTRTSKETTGVSPSESPTGRSKDAKPGQAAPVTPQVPAEPAAPK